MKRAFFYTIFLSGAIFLQVSALAQVSTFNKVYPLERPNTAYQEMVVSDTTVYILGKVKYQPTGDLQVYLLKTDSLGIKEWDQVYGDPGIDEFVAQLKAIGNEEYLILLVRSNYHMEWNNFFCRSVILKLKSDNEILEFWESNGEDLLFTNFIDIIDENNILVTGSIGNEIPINANTSTIKNK